MNQKEAEDYNGPTFNCPNCDGRHPLDKSETCDDTPKTDGGAVKPSDDVEYGTRDVPEDTDFQFVQGEDVSGELLEVADVTTTEREQFVGWFTEQQVAKMSAFPGVNVVERLRVQDHGRIRVKFQVEATVEVEP